MNFVFYSKRNAQEFCRLHLVSNRLWETKQLCDLFQTDCVRLPHFVFCYKTSVGQQNNFDLLQQIARDFQRLYFIIFFIPATFLTFEKTLYNEF